MHSRFMEKAFHTTDPQEADSLEAELERISIEYHVQEEASESGIAGFTFFVASGDLKSTIQRAKVIRARSLSNNPDIEDFSEASAVLKEHKAKQSERIQSLSAPALFQVLWRFRRTIAIGFLPVAIPIAHWLQGQIQFSSNVRSDTTIAYLVSFGLVISLLGILYLLLKPKSNDPGYGA